MRYSKTHLREISFPLGGIGSGCIGLAGNGRLVDWEIFNRPSKGSLNGYSHIAVRAQDDAGEVSARVLQGDLDKDLTGSYALAPYIGYGFGPSSLTMCGFPHFSQCTFDGEFPIARLSFSDPHFPGEVSLTAFNPLIPLDDRNSSIPAAFFEIEFSNPADKPRLFTAAFTVANPFPVSENRAEGDSIRLTYAGMDPADPRYGDLTISCRAPETGAQPCWYRGGWQDGIATFWREFSSGKPLRRREYDSPGQNDTCTLWGSVRLAPGERKSVRFVLSWNVPNNYNYWNPVKDEEGKDVTWKNYYAVLFPDSGASASYAMENWDSLYARTLAFHDALFSSSLDPAVLDAASASLAVLKSPTVLRLEDGSFYGWEGVQRAEGSCEGTCQHVWNYAYALCFLFPQLERSIRDLEFKWSTYENGEMDFRLKLPLGREKGKFRACVDGQMGSVIKTYREWKLSGDDSWLKAQWPSVKKVLAYAWSPENADRWDADKDGVLEGRQHHTLDMELFGPSSWLEGFYLAALAAAAEMADFLGDGDAAEYRELFRKGRDWTRENLFNGKYFIQKVNLDDRSVLDGYKGAEGYWNEEAGEIKYQIGEGCEIDQLLAQWHANLCGLGRLFDEGQTQTALRSLFANNYKTSVREFANPWRIFCLNDESGTVICDYPEGVRKPVLPIPYCEETMHGFEYALAGLLISEGFTEEGLTVVRAVRDRYNGEKRNPWNEIECGSNYARSMAAFALLPIFSGFRFDLPHQSVGFEPVGNPENFRCFWSVGTGWGVFAKDGGKVRLTIEEGSLALREIALPFLANASSLTIDGENVPFRQENGAVRFESACIRRELAVTL